MDKITLLIVDDHAIVRTGLAALLEAKGGFKVSGEADNGEAAVKETLRLKPDVVVMDLMMPVKDGITATREILAARPETKILILTTSTVPADLAQAREAGALGIVAKTSGNAALIDAVKAVAAGSVALSPEIAAAINSCNALPDLTERQQNVLHYVSQGLSNPEIAKTLGVSVITIKKHMESILAKLGAANRSEAITIAVRIGLLKV